MLYIVRHDMALYYQMVQVKLVNIFFTIVAFFYTEDDVSV